MRSLIVCFVAMLVPLAGCGDDGGSVTADGGVDAGGDLDAAPIVCQASVPFEWPVPTALVTITPNAAWKNQVASQDDAFLSFWSPQEIRWIKFAILMSDPSKVYFQKIMTRNLRNIWLTNSLTASR